MADWIPLGELGPGPRYRAIVEALDADIAAGRLLPGARLLPHRDLAERLGLSVGTVSRAYAEAEERGLISGEVGRGTFVRRRAAPVATASVGPVDLALNVPPETGEAAAIAAAMAVVAAEPDLVGLLGYQPHQGSRRHRDAVAEWFGRHAHPVGPGAIFITQGAQHALSVALPLVARPGDTVLTESLTYSGMAALAAFAGVTLHGVPLDEHGIVPAALEAAFRTTGARALYLTPTLQTPTAVTMPPGRRREVAELVRAHDAVLIEDDAYGFLPESPIAPVAYAIPERSFYVVSFAKCLAPGLRVGAMTIPDAFRDRVLNGLRATGWMAAPVMVEVLARLIGSGELARQAKLKRDSARRRIAIAQAVLGARLRLPDGPSFHLWLPLPLGRTASALVGQAASLGVTLSGPAVLRPFDPTGSGIRLCLGAPRSEEDLERALGTVASILEGADPISVV